MTKWEYKAVILRLPELDKPFWKPGEFERGPKAWPMWITARLNEFGQEGWELIQHDDQGTSGLYLIFKRPK